jgi:hypothetical protein
LCFAYRRTGGFKLAAKDPPLTHTQSRTEPPTKQIKAIETKLNE